MSEVQAIPYRTLTERLTAIIDHVNQNIVLTSHLPCRIEKMHLEGEGQLATIYCRFDDGALFIQPVAGAFLTPTTVLEAVHRAFLIQHQGIVPMDWIEEAKGYEPVAVAWASDCDLKTGAAETHVGVERVQ